jgi:hypothetical protein
MSRQTFAVIVAGAMALASMVPASADQGKDDQWSVTASMSMTKPMAMSMPAMTHAACTPANADQGPPQMQNADCKVEHFERSGKRASYKVSCNMHGTQMTGEGWTEKPDDDHYKGEMHVSGSTQGMPMDMTMTYTGVRTGSCTAKQ